MAIDNEMSVPRALFAALPGVDIRSSQFRGVTFVIGSIELGPFSFDIDENGQVVAPGSVDLPDSSS